LNATGPTPSGRRGECRRRNEIVRLFHRQGGAVMILILLWLLGVPLGLIIILWLIGVGR
jgi:hypothetical protein